MQLHLVTIVVAAHVRAHDYCVLQVFPGRP
jgi:hypothetical protein